MEEQFEEILKNKIVNCHNRNTIFDTLKYIDYDKAIDAMKEVWKLAKPEWISVKDRVPIIGQYVLVYCEEKCFQPTNFAISQYGKYGFTGNETVTHWKELIKPNI